MLKAQVVNDSCHQAIEIFCGDSFNVDFGGHNSNASDRFEDCQYSNFDESVWYKIIGTGDIIQVALCNYSVELKILTGDCDSLICFNEVSDFFLFR